MQIKHNYSLFIFALTILLFGATCPPVQAQTSPNDIAFYRISPGNLEIYTMKADGSNQTNLSNTAAGFDAFPDWSPNGSRIVFSRDSAIWVMNADGSNKIRLTNPVDADDIRPNWSPDGSKIVFAREAFSTNIFGDIYVMNADGSNQVKLTTAVSGQAYGSPRWSPDGTKIVFRDDRNVQTGGDEEIYVMNANGSNQTALTNNTVSDGAPDWSPDGSKIAFHTFRNGNFKIYVMNADGSNQTRITNNPALDAAPSWSPDGTKFVFVTNRDGNDEIYTMNTDGSNPIRLTNNTVPDEAPRWKRNGTAVPRAVFLDFFGTGKSNYLFLTPENGVLRWDILRNPAGQPPQTRRVFWGLDDGGNNFDYAVVGDYDGDLKTDVGVWRLSDAANPQQAYFYIQRSSNPNPNAIYAQPWGLPTDIPATGDYDGDGKDDFTVVRRETGMNDAWYILPSGGGNFRRIEFGLATDAILSDSQNDFNNDGREDLLVARSDAATGNITFFVGDALTGQLILAQQWGNANAAQGGPVFLFYGNYLGDSRADVGIYYGACPSNPNCEIGGTWWFKETGSSNYTVTKFGVPLNFNSPEDFPINGDFDGDGKFDISVFRLSNKTFYSLRSSDGQIQAQYWDGNSATPPDSASLFENVIKPRGESIPAGALKAMTVTKQPDGTFKTERVSDFYFKR